MYFPPAFVSRNRGHIAGTLPPSPLYGVLHTTITKPAIGLLQISGTSCQVWHLPRGIIAATIIIYDILNGGGRSPVNRGGRGSAKPRAPTMLCFAMRRRRRPPPRFNPREILLNKRSFISRALLFPCLEFFRVFFLFLFFKRTQQSY